MNDYVTELLELIHSCNEEKTLIIDETSPPCFDIDDECDSDNDYILKVYCLLTIEGHEHKEYAYFTQDDPVTKGMNEASKNMVRKIKEIISDRSYHTIL